MGFAPIRSVALAALVGCLGLAGFAGSGAAVDASGARLHGLGRDLSAIAPRLRSEPGRVGFALDRARRQLRALEIEARGDDSFRTLHRGLIERHEATISKVLDHYFAAMGTKPPMPLPQLTATLVALFKGFALSRHNRSDMPVSSASAVRLLLGLSD